MQTLQRLLEARFGIFWIPIDRILRSKAELGSEEDLIALSGLGEPSCS